MPIEGMNEFFSQITHTHSSLTSGDTGLAPSQKNDEGRRRLHPHEQETTATTAAKGQ